jgi:pSer/pThr/pTyr-binding forkhead associated (FHA) protein
VASAAAEPVPAPAPVPPPSRDLHLTVVHGTAEQTTYVFSIPRVNLGRCAEVRDSRSRLVRTNHVAFVDLAGTSNDSVSRQHAHIEYVEPVGHYRIRDDRSAQGTSIVRNGRTMTVPAGSRGIRLEPGDEVVLGEARVRVQIQT